MKRLWYGNIFALTAIGVRLLLQPERWNLRINLTYNICKGVCKEIMDQLEIQYHLRRYCITQKVILEKPDVRESIVPRVISGDRVTYRKKCLRTLFCLWISSRRS